MLLILFIFHVKRMLKHTKFPEIPASVSVGQCESNTVFGLGAFNVECALMVNDVTNFVPAEKENVFLINTNKRSLKIN